jgi:CubicO group peptidase (beta-lactamase class C family)
MASRFDSVLQAGVVSGDVPGVVACVTDKVGATYEGAFGKRVIDQSAEMTPDTVFWIASMTKAITSAAAVQMVEQGKLELDAPAKAVIPEIGNAQVLIGFDDSGQPRLRAPARDVTLRHLLTHTAGFSYEMWNADIPRCQEVLGLPSTNSGEKAMLNTPLLFDPGERWEYGTNIDWAGLMVEAASGKKLGQYFRDNLLGPLRMEDTSFVISPAMRERLAKVHHRGRDGSLSPNLSMELPQEPEFEPGGHGLYGSAPDYLKFMRMFLNEGRADDGRQVLTPAAVSLLSENAMGDTPVTAMKTVSPQMSNDVEFFPGYDKRWSLGFMTNEEEAPTGRSAGSLAWAGIANCYHWIDPGKGIGGVFFTQILPFADERVLKLFYEFETAVYQQVL